jgi:predicted RecA/RadA family phage recombinase
MKNLVRKGEIIDYTNSGSAIASGDVVTVGNRIGIAETNIAATTGNGPVRMEGVFLLAKTTSQAWTQGQDLFWDGTKLTTVGTGNTRAGFADVAAASADTTGYVNLEPLNKQMPVQAASTAADTAAMVVDFNLLLGKLKAAGLMANS